MNLNAKRVEKLPKAPKVLDENRCAWCNRDFKSPSERIQGKRYAICESCYRSIFNPNRNCCELEFF